MPLSPVRSCGLEEGGNSVADGEALAGGAEQGFAGLFGDDMQGVAGEGALQTGDGLGPVGPGVVFAGVEESPDG